MRRATWTKWIATNLKQRPRRWTSRRASRPDCQLLTVAARFLALVFGATLLLGCGSNLGSPILNVLTPTGPSRFTLDPLGTGPLDRDEAALALPDADTPVARSLLSRLGFRRAAVRVWTDGPRFASVLGIRLGGATSASKLLDFERSALREQASTATLTTFPPISGAALFVLSGSARQDQRNLFCEGIAFTEGQIFFSVLTCSSEAPGDTTAVAALAQSEFTTVKGGIR